MLGQEASYEELLENIKSLVKSEKDQLRAMQLLAASYNGGVGIIEDALSNPNLKSFSQMYDYHVRNVGSQENRDHMMKVGRCLLEGNFKPPYGSSLPEVL